MQETNKQTKNLNICVNPREPVHWHFGIPQENLGFY